MADGGNFLLQAVKAALYSLLLNSAMFSFAICMAFFLRSSAKAAAITAIVTFVLSLYLGYGMMFGLPVTFLPIYQIRQAVGTAALFQPVAVLVGAVWITALLWLSWRSFRKCELK